MSVVQFLHASALPWGGRTWRLRRPGRPRRLGPTGTEPRRGWDHRGRPPWTGAQSHGDAVRLRTVACAGSV